VKQAGLENLRVQRYFGIQLSTAPFIGRLDRSYDLP